MGGGGSSPPPPDPVATAQAQTAMNVETARVQNQLSRVNQVGPDGTITYSQAPGTSALDQSAYDAAKQRMLATRPQFDAAGNAVSPELSPEEDAALRGEFTKHTPSDQWTMQTQLSPEQQQIYDLSNQAKLTYGQAANDQLRGVQGILSQAFDGQPYMAMQGGAMAGTAGALDRSRAIANQGFNAQPYTDASGQALGIAQSAASQPFNASPYLNIGDDQIARANNAASQPFQDPGQQAMQQSLAQGGAASARASQLAGSPINTDYNAVRQQAIDAANSRLQPDFADQEDRLRSRLLNTGFAEGSEAWNRAYRQMNNAQNDSRQQTILNAEALAGQAIQQTGALRQIPLNELAQAQQIAAGYGQQGYNAFQQAAGARQIPIQEALAIQGMATQGLQNQAFARNIPFQEASQISNLATQGLANQGVARQIPLSEQQQIAQLSGAFGNQASQGLQSALTVRNQPLNEAAALLTGSAVQQPQLQQTPGSTVAPVDYGGMVQNSYAGQVAEANRKAQIQQANTGAAAGAVGAIGSAAVAAIIA